MFNKKILKRSLVWSLVLYCIAITISVLLREFSPIEFWDYNPTNDYNLLVFIIFSVYFFDSRIVFWFIDAIRCNFLEIF